MVAIVAFKLCYGNCISIDFNSELFTGYSGYHAAAFSSIHPRAIRRVEQIVGMS